MRRILSLFFNFPIQPPCYLCGAPSYQPLPICSECESDLPWNHNGCSICDLPLQQDATANGQICNQCFSAPKAFDRVYSAFEYRYPIDALIGQFKYSGQRHLGRLQTQLLHKHLSIKDRKQISEADLVIPMPIAPKRYKERGFNQASDMALYLGKKLACNVAVNGIKRADKELRQASATRAQRQANMEEIFALKHAFLRRINGSHIILVDDVVTTGASTDALARVLKSAGALRVDVLCLARTPEKKIYCAK